MATDTAAIQKIQTLKSDAAKIGGFHDWFAKAFADKKHHDKQGFGFNPSSSSEYFAFKTNVWFYAYAGQYGSSSVYSQLSLNDGKAVNEVFIAAINKHQKLIFATMAEIMEKQAGALREKAEIEIAAMQAMLETLDVPVEAGA
ncbi:hypothetical protein HRR99_03085 [Agrobacterium vaccinii]|uniref:hypothetical protein n=1 Tax=Agrobacterium vaccinii TaxID=2735528 RepID=UPI001E4AD549|nr:hypothetical protein [Agrobacterium vaccinii]UHS60576.1 hypothetical protein HRR99_03085 [Agrobacterium vaccinii]